MIDDPKTPFQDLVDKCTVGPVQRAFFAGGKSEIPAYDLAFGNYPPYDHIRAQMGMVMAIDVCGGMTQDPDELFNLLIEDINESVHKRRIIQEKAVLS